MKKNIIIAVNSQLVKTVIYNYFDNDNVIAINSLEELLSLEKVENAIFIAENSFLAEVNPGFIITLSEFNKTSKSSVLLITSSNSLRVIYSLTIPNILVSAPDKIINYLPRLICGEIDFAFCKSHNFLKNKLFEKTIKQKFLEVYSINIIDNILDINNYFYELVNMLETAFNIKKIIIEFITDNGTFIFTTINKIFLEPFVSNIQGKKIFYTEQTHNIEENESHYKIPISINGIQKGCMHIIYNEYETDQTFIELNTTLINILRKFYFYLSTTLYRETFKNKCIDVDKIKIIMDKIFKEPIPEFIKIINHKTNTSSFAVNNDLYIISSHTSFYNHSLLTFYTYHLANQKIDFNDIVLKLNIFIHKNLLKFLPIPISLIKVDKNTLTFCATNDMPLIDYSNKDLIFCKNPYFGMYKNLDIDVKSLNIDKSSKYIHLPDYILISEGERKDLISRVLYDNKL